MRVSTLAVLGFVPLRSFAFEQPPDVNLTKALLNNGVTLSALPKMTDLDSRKMISVSTSCNFACGTLKAIFSDDQVVQKSTAAYSAFSNYFWSQQQQAPQPKCVFKPKNAVDVSTFILIARLTQCPFAFRSGGHAAFAGASNIDGGITVTFDKMKGISLSKDKKIVSVQAGNNWGDIYSALQDQNLAVVGGRVSTIGVGGFLTGGGISFFSNQYGWGCDNVASYEVVLACGTIVTASPTSNPDLYWALRGGGNNFGIVTKFHLETFPHGAQMFGGQRIFLSSAFPALIDAFVKLGHSNDAKAEQILSVGILGGMQAAAIDLEYADPVPAPPVFADYLKIPAIQDTLRVDSLLHFTQELNQSNPYGFRQTFWTAASALDRGMVQFAFDVALDEYAKIGDVQGVLPANTLQVITVQQLEQMQKKGGNALGIKPSDGPLLLLNPNAHWSRPEDDGRVLQASANIVRRFQQEAKRRNMARDFLYMNYASQYEDVISSYGAANAQRLRRIAKQYDPQQVFQKLQPGYFKLNGAPSAMH
ncbi:hypothetical protein ACEQ8H_008110 [Pleosporales sp. CAS-2024a]